MTGTLYVVATPIGNLSDISARAKEVLDTVAVALCEDTRHTRKLLSHLDIHPRTLSYHDHNEATRTPEVIEMLMRGDDVALVSDAGTPLVSDPGYRLVRACRENDIPVRAIPGPSAVLAAVAVSGLPSTSFLFLGFLPSKGKARALAIDDVIASRHQVVLFEAPTRVARLLEALAEIAPEREGCVFREMTKRYEEHRCGRLRDLAQWATSKAFKGEITLVIGPKTTKTPMLADDALRPAFDALKSDGHSAREASKRLAKQSALTAREIYHRFGR